MFDVQYICSPSFLISDLYSRWNSNIYIILTKFFQFLGKNSTKGGFGKSDYGNINKI